MIHSLSFSNFYSFKDKVTIDFVVDKNSPDTDAYFTDKFGNRISKIMTVIGANASGKTNLLKSLVFLKWFIVDSFSSLGPNDTITNGFKPFLFCEDNNKSNFEIVFGLNDDIYSYELELTQKQVFKEVLNIKNRETNRWNIVFDRVFNQEDKTYKVNFSKLLDIPSDFEKIVRGNSSVLSTANQIGNSYAIKIVNYFSNIQSSTDGVESIGKNIYESIFNAADFFRSKPEMKEKAERILQSFDLGLSKFSFQELKAPEGKSVFVPMTHHKHSDNDKEASLMMFEESGGTRNLFVLLKDILAALDTGDIVVFDELDNNLHALMVPELVNLFTSKKHNPKNAQLLFSTHNLQILNELDKAQIVIVEKNEKNISEAWKLSDIEGVRTDENYYTKYLTGMYGGIPKF